MINIAHLLFDVVDEHIIILVFELRKPSSPLIKCDLMKLLTCTGKLHQHPFPYPFWHISYSRQQLPHLFASY